MTSAESTQGDTEETVTLIRSFSNGLPGTVKSVKISPNGSTIAVASDSGVINIWNPATGTCITTLHGHARQAVSICIAYSPNGSLLVSGAHDAIIAWETGSWTEVGKINTDGGYVRDIAFQPDGSKFIYACAESCRIATWSPAGFEQSGEIIGLDTSVHAVDFSPNGSAFALGCYDGSVGLASTGSNALFRRSHSGHTDLVGKVKFSPDGSKLASASDDHTVCLWDAFTGNPLAVFEGHTRAVSALAFSFSSVLISGSYDDSLRLWHVLKKYAIGSPVKCHDGSSITEIDTRDGELFVSSSSRGAILLWRLNLDSISKITPPSFDYFDGTTMRKSVEDECSVHSRVDTKAVISAVHVRNVLRGHTHWVNSVAFSPEGSYIASGSEDKTVRIWRLDHDKDDKPELTSMQLTGHKDVVHCVAFSPDGKMLASASHIILLWDTITGKLIGRPFWGHTDKVHTVVFSHDGQRLLSGGRDWTARVWDVNEAEEIDNPYTRHRHTIHSIDVTAGGLVATGSADETVHVWDMETKATICGPLKGHTEEVRATKFSPDGMVLASASDDSTVRLWDVLSGTTIVILQRHTSSVRSIAFAPGGSVLVSCSEDTSVIFWDTRRGDSIGPPLHYPEEARSSSLYSVDISADGRRLVAGASSSETICVWDIQIASEKQPALGSALVETDPDAKDALSVLSTSASTYIQETDQASTPNISRADAALDSSYSSVVAPPFASIAPSSPSPLATPAAPPLAASRPPASDMHEDGPAQEAALGPPPSIPTALEFVIDQNSYNAPSTPQSHTASGIAETESNPERLASSWQALSGQSPISRPIQLISGGSSSTGTSESGSRNRREHERVSMVTWWTHLNVRLRREATDGDASKDIGAPEQSERLNVTRRRVVRAANSVLGTTVDITHEALKAGVDLLDMAPVPGLAAAGHILLDIWSAVQQVQTNRTACQELTKRCADLLISVREEIVEAGSDVSEELKAPIDKLHRAFQDVLLLMRKQMELPFLKRYLAREKTLKEITQCDAALVSALDMFSLSVQLRTLKLMQSSLKSSFKIIGNRREPISRSKVAENLRALRAQQNDQDRIEDSMHLRQLLRAAVETHDDVAMVEILQVGRDEMPEAMSALERTLQGSDLSSGTGDGPETRLGRRESILSRVGVRRGRVPNAPSPPTESIDREFMQTGVEALRRLTLQHGSPHELPSWTITRYEIDLEQKIGIGFFSVVHKGTWRDRTVAIKMLADTTPKSLFIREAALWKTFSHINIVPLLGASSASSNPPWFFVSPYYKNGNLVKFLKDLPILHIEIILRCMQEIAAGMMYLHEHDVLHGDLKAVNVLVDDNLSCVITDFGQSEMRSEVFRLSRLPVSRGTLRWQAPELMEGASAMTREIDVYAYAITCIEVMTKGGLPWPLQDDAVVRHLVLVENQRPPLPLHDDTADGRLYNVLEACWHRDPTQRLSFPEIVDNLAVLRQSRSRE